MSSLRILMGSSGIVLAGVIAVIAQQPQTQSQPVPNTTLRQESIERRERRRDRLVQRRRERLRWHGPRLGRLARQLELTEAQRQQARAIIEHRRESTRAQRAELSKLREKRIAGAWTAAEEARALALRQELRIAMQGVRSEMSGVLTAEQKAKLEQLKQERKLRREQRMRTRQDRLQQKLQ